MIQIPVPASRQVWSRLAWLGVYAVAMGLLEAICVIYLRRLFPLETNFPIPPLERLHIELIREVCTIIMLVAVAWLSGPTLRLRLACFFYAFGIWDILYYAGLWWLSGWPDSLLTWDCLFLIPKPWYGPVLAPVLISLYFVLGCCWLHARELRGAPVRLSVGLIGSQLLAFAVWYWSFVKDADHISAHAYKGAKYSWCLFVIGALVGVGGLLLASRSSQKLSFSGAGRCF
jgi:hypothetical protein